MMGGSGAFMCAVYLLAGLVSGFCSSTPLGPINLWIADAVLMARSDATGPFIAGVVATDVSLAAMAAWGYASLSEIDFGALGHNFFHSFQGLGKEFLGYPPAAWLSLAGGLFLVGLGLANLAKLRASQRENAKFSPTTHSRWRYFGLGMFFCGSNPAFLLFWVFVVSFLDTHLHGPVTPAARAFLLVGVTLGDCLWFAFFKRLIRRGAGRVGPAYLRLLRVAISSAFIVLGTVAVLHNFKRIA